MPEFNRMTIVAASEAIESEHSQNEFTSLATQWGVEDYCGSGALLARTNNLARVAISMVIDVHTPSGKQPLSRAMIECAVSFFASPKQPDAPYWKKLVAGLRMDGFEIVQPINDDAHDDIFGNTRRSAGPAELRPMMPEDVPALNFREAESEIEVLLSRHGLQVAKGHLSQAVANFGLGNWSAANAMIRDYYQELLDKIAEKLGCDPKVSDDAKRQYLASDASGPFLFHEYNEWENERGRPAYVLGLWARLHPHGSHPGLSDEEDCAFRFQIILVTSRLFLRRFDKRVKSL